MAVLPVVIKGTLQGTAPIKRKMYSMRLALVAVLLLFQQGTFGLVYCTYTFLYLSSLRVLTPKGSLPRQRECSAAP